MQMESNKYGIYVVTLSNRKHIYCKAINKDKAFDICRPISERDHSKICRRKTIYIPPFACNKFLEASPNSILLIEIK
jgi:hypothetical protein